MRQLLLLLSVSVLFVVSCKKEDSQQSAPPLLQKVVSKDGSGDSIVTTYQYNSLNRITEEKIVDGSDITTTTLARDAQGRVTKLTLTESSPGTSPEVTVTDFVYLGPSDLKVRNGITLFSGVKDSTAFVYTGTKVSRTSHFYSAPSFPAQQLQYYEFRYDGKGNMTEAKIYQDANITGTLALVGTLTMTYDDKVNPIYSNDDALVESITSQYVSPNNVTRFSFVSPNTANNFTANISYEYRADGRPTKSTLTEGGFTQVSNYTYNK